ncbi:3473_t:CDS:2, partial [Gigaspora rosea]
QYTKITEYETHLSSYDHNHRKRFKEMKETINPALQKVGSKSPFTKGTVDDEIFCSETIKNTSTVNSKTNGGWVSSVESTSTDCTQNGPKFIRATSNTSGWIPRHLKHPDTQPVQERIENVEIVIDNKSSAENNSSKSKFTFGIGKPTLEQSE